MFSRTSITRSTGNYSDNITKLKREIEAADAVLIGAGAGLSTSAGFTYTGERFQKYFADFIEKYSFRDMYSGGFYPFTTPEEHWAYWSRYIYVNRYMDAPKPVYQTLLDLVKSKDYFVITTNVDHCFQKAGFDKKRLFYVQGDYGLFQCAKPCDIDTWDNEELIRKMVLSQGFELGADGALTVPEGKPLAMSIPSGLLPLCPNCGQSMTMNLRSDDKFVEDPGWLEAAGRYSDFVRACAARRILYLELGVGYNTPGIIKYSFWSRTAQNPKAVYACVNLGEAACPKEIEGQALCINEDIGKVLADL